MALYDHEREVGMRSALAQKMEALKEAPLKDLKVAYVEYFQAKKASNNRTYMWRRLAYRMQELEYGELSAKAQAKLKALTDAYDPVNNAALKPQVAISGLLPKRDRLPGTIITKDYKGTKIQIKTLGKGFEYGGKIYKSLTAIAKEITGAHWNGFLFFNL
jgi:hypothetical protein